MSGIAAQDRFYRHRVQPAGLTGFRVVVRETDLQIHAERDLTPLVRELVLMHRGFIEACIGQYPEFLDSLVPVRIAEPVPAVVQDMLQAGAAAGVGPMAAVAGAVAEHVGRDLLRHSAQVVVENGGDLFIKTERPLVMGLYAGSSPLSLKVGLRVGGADRPMAACTSSGTVGHSLSLGCADAVCVLSAGGALADAAATAVGNRVGSAADLNKAIEFGRSIPGVVGLVVVVKDRIGCWGDVELVPLSTKKG